MSVESYLTELFERNRGRHFTFLQIIKAAKVTAPNVRTLYRKTINEMRSKGVIHSKPTTTEHVFWMPNKRKAKQSLGNAPTPASTAYRMRPAVPVPGSTSEDFLAGGGMIEKLPGTERFIPDLKRKDRHGY